MAKLLTKSKYLNGLKCPKYLWLLCNASDQIPAVDAATQSRFDQGNEAGELAKRLFPGGVDIPTENFGANVARTGQLLREGETLFEAGSQGIGYRLCNIEASSGRTVAVIGRWGEQIVSDCKSSC